MDNSGLDDFLNDSNAAADDAGTVAAAPASADADTSQADAAAEAAGQARDDVGRFASKGDKETDAQAASADGASPAPGESPPLEHPALLGERRRRQEAERQLAELQARFVAPEAPQLRTPQPADGPPDRFEDPEGYDAWLVQTATQQARAEAVAAHQEERIMSSADAAREKYPDWTEKAAAFAQLARQNPALERTLRSHPNPAEYAYSTAKMHLELAQHGSLEGLIAARVAEAVAKATPAPAPAADIQLPESLAGSQSARSSAAAAGPPSLDDILNPRK